MPSRKAGFLNHFSKNQEIVVDCFLKKANLALVEAKMVVF